MSDAGERTHRACSTIGADDHPAVQSLGLARMGYRYARQTASRQIESDDTGSMPYRHMAEPRGGAQEAGADRAVLEAERRPHAAVALIGQFDPIAVRTAMRENTETLDGHRIRQPDTVVEAEVDE